MSYSPQVSVLLTVAFTVTGLGYAGFALRSGGSPVARVGDLLHLLMSAAMLAMPWPWGMQVAPPMVQMLVFGLGAVFFSILLVAGKRVAGHGHEGGRVVLGYHVVMMAAMVVMALLMQGGGSGAMASMPGMDMGSSIGGLTMSPALTAVSWLLVAVFVAAAVWMFVRLVSAGRSAHPVLARAEDALLLMMSAGMALAFLPA